MTGTTRALQFLDQLGRPDGREPSVAVTFAKIIIGLFPPWFDAGPDKLALLGNDGCVRLVIANADDLRSIDHAMIQTTDSRCMSCDVYRRGTRESGQMNMHYRPSDAQLEQARAVIAFALHHLFPRQSTLPAELAALVPAGRIFPPDSWFRH